MKILRSCMAHVDHLFRLREEAHGIDRKNLSPLEIAELARERKRIRQRLRKHSKLRQKKR